MEDRHFIKRPSGYLQLRFKVGSSWKGISTGTTSLQTAKRKAQELIDKWKRENPKKMIIPKRSVDWDSEIERYLKTQKEHKKEGTKRPIRRHLEQARDVFGVPINKVTVKLFNERVEALRGEVSPKTWANTLTNIRGFFRWQLDEKNIGEDPTKNAVLPPRSSFGRRTGKDVWTDEELRQVCDALPKFERDVLRTIRFTGLDSSDVFELRREHIVKDSEGHLCISKRREKAKSADEHINQPLSPDVLKILKPRIKKAVEPEDKIFPSAYLNSNSFGATLLKKVGRAWTMESSKKDVKSLRHTFASFHANRGVPEDVLRRWMGHSPYSRILEALYIHRKSTAKYMF